MSLLDLKSLIEFASVQAENIFGKTGELYPMYHCIKADGETRIVHYDKDLSVGLIKAWFVIENVDRYVFMAESWIVPDSRGQLRLDVEKIRREGVRNHPERREIVMFSAENIRGEMLTAKRFILRPEIGKPQLAPLKIDEPFEYSGGRMVGLLNWQEGKS